MKKVFITLLAIAGIALAAAAQESKTMYIMKNGKVAYQSVVSEIDSIIFYQPDTPTVDEEGVIINGVKWATRNVDAPGSFAANPEDAGMFYQWNRKIGWSATDPMVNSNGGATWDSNTPSGDTWERTNDPSPAGWRVPTIAEIQKLTDTNYVTYVWIDNNGLTGVKFTDKATGKSIFLPAAGSRGGYDGTFSGVGSNGTYGIYWSSTAYAGGINYLYFASLYAYCVNAPDSGSGRLGRWQNRLDYL